MSRSKVITSSAAKDEAMGFDTMVGGQSAMIDENYIGKREQLGSTNVSTNSGNSSPYVSVDAEPFELISTKDTYGSDKTMII
jgi:hypothetical protein